MSKMPYISFYVGDYIKSTRVLNLEEKGAWTEILWHIWEHGQAGIIEGTWEDICLIIGCPDLQKCKSIFSKILAKKVCELVVINANNDLSLETVRIVNRRMEREFNLKKKRSEIGKSGGEAKAENSSKALAKTYQITDNDIEDDIEDDFKNKIDIQSKLSEFYLFRKQLKKPIIKASVKSFRAKLIKLSNANEADAIAILEQSIANGWQGIFALQQQRNGQQNSNNRTERTGSIANAKGLSEAILDDYSSKNGS